VNRYRCPQGHWYSISHKEKDPILWIRHIDGAPIRKLADEVGLSVGEVYDRVTTELNQLPQNNELTKEYCNRFSGICIVDAKYVKVRGYPKKIAFCYALDYLTHDPIVSVLAATESELAWARLFALLKTFQYPLQIVVADDNAAIRQGLARVFPNSRFQLCQVHYLENIRKTLCVRTDETHRAFFFTLKKLVFDEHENFPRLRGVLHHLLTRYAFHDSVRQEILLDIERRKFELFAYTEVPRCPKNTNLIELYNSHLNGRLKTIKGFKTVKGALRWLNGYLIRRRTKAFTDCEGQFKHLNGFCSLEKTIKKQAQWPDLYKQLYE
jgi:transposase-like protein